MKMTHQVVLKVLVLNDTNNIHILTEYLVLIVSKLRLRIPTSKRIRFE